MSATTRNALVWHRATVSDGEDDRLVATFADPSACARCARGEGCGAAYLSRLFGGSAAVLPLPAGIDVRPGDAVRIGIEERWLLQAAVLTYLLPATAFIGGALTAHALMPGHDAAALAAGLAAAATGLIALKSRLARISSPRLVVRAAGDDPAGSLESGNDGAHVGCQLQSAARTGSVGVRIRKDPS